MVQCVIFGGLILDRYYEVDRFPQRGQDAIITGEFSVVGGCSINMAATFNNLGGRAHVVSCLGRGPIGEALHQYLHDHRFSQRFVYPVEEDSGYCDVFLEPDGERTFFSRKGAEKRVPPDLKPEDLSGIAAAAVTGYYLLDEPEPVLSLLEDFSRRGGKVLVDLGPLLDRLAPETVRRALDAASVITANNTEAALLGLEERTAQIVVIKKGARGGSVTAPGLAFDYSPAPARVVDTTGAGDSFDAGLLYGLATNMDLRDAVALGAACAAKTIAIMGPHGFWEMKL